jgi:poly(3-hydroxybutyrate) depolymerase
MRKQMLAALLLSTAAIANEPAPTLNIDADRVTVSGISAGAHMAQQLHIAYSDLFSGAGIVSGGPYGCADNSLITAMSQCMDNTDEPLPLADLLAGIRTAAAEGKIADTGNLADDRVWLFHGTLDSTISAEVHDAAGAIYAEFIPAGQIHRVDDVAAGHFFPAKGRGHPCTDMQPPFVGDCDYDAAGKLLRYLYPGLSTPTSEAMTGLQKVTLPGAGEAELLAQAYLFVPPDCADGAQTCALHLVLHGCAQSAETVGTGFIEQSGYLPWAESNNIVLAFPQVKKSLVAPLNPHACWDWWGYTNDNYLWRDGAQMKVLADWVASLSKKYQHAN